MVALNAISDTDEIQTAAATNQRAWQFKAYPTPAQAAAIERQMELHRLLYNNALAARKGSFERVRWRYKYGDAQTRAGLRQGLPTYVTQNKELTGVRADLPEYRAMACSAEQRTLRRLDKAYAAFFRRVGQGQTPGYPRYKGRGRFTSIEWTAGQGARLVGDRAYFQGVGHVKVRLYRPLPEGARVKAIWLTKRASGYWVILSLEQPAVSVPPREGPAVGLDVGLRHYVQASDGAVWDWPRPYAAALKRLRVLQRSVSRKQRGSNRRADAVQQLARLHEHVANQRREYQRLLARDLCAAYGTIAVEDLAIAEMVRSERYPFAQRGLNRGASDAAWRQLLGILRLRAERDGVRIVTVPAADTTQQCSRCGALADPPITIFEREFHCRTCGLRLGQDQNAAINIAAAARTAAV